MGGSCAQSFRRHRYRLAPLLALCLLPLLPAPASPCPPDSLRAVVVTVDGIRRSEFLDWSGALLSWAGRHGSYIPFVANLTRGVTDPNHAILWGSGDPGQCGNREGHPANPMHFELLRKERGLPRSATAVVSGKTHLVEMNRHSDHPDYGENYEATTLLIQSEAPPCMPGTGVYEGPDSLIARAALSFLEENDVVWMGINLSEYDFLAHPIGLYCVGRDTLLYWARLEEVYREAQRLILQEIWPFLSSHPRYAGKTALIVTTDHGRHLDDVSSGFLNHGHGWLPDSTGCALNCDGCRDGWAVLAGPGICKGTVALGSYFLEDLPATLRYLMRFGNPYQSGLAIGEVLINAPTAVVGPVSSPGGDAAWLTGPNPFRGTTSLQYRLDRPSPVRLTIYDVEGREIFASDIRSLPAGTHSVAWEGRDRFGRPVAPGVYLCALQSPDFSLRRKITLLR